MPLRFEQRRGKPKASSLQHTKGRVQLYGVGKIDYDCGYRIGFRQE